MFRDRFAAGMQLGAALRHQQGTDAIVVGIPRGGTAVGDAVAQALGLPFAILVVRKLPFPDSPEAGFGAVAEDGTVYLLPSAQPGLPAELVDRVIREQRAEVTRRVAVLRGGQPLPDLRDRRVILVDDGLAMGSSMQAAVLCCRHRGVGHVTVAVPVAGPEAAAALRATADEFVALLTPPRLRAVAEFYQYWHDVSDEEVLATLSQAARAGRLLGAPRAAESADRPGQDIAPGPRGTDMPCIR